VDLQQGNEECSRRPVPVPMRDTQARAQSRGLQHMRLAAPAAPCHGRDELRPLSEPHGRQQPSKQVGGEGRAANRPPGAVLCSGGMGEVVRWFTAPAVGVGGARGGGGGVAVCFAWIAGNFGDRLDSKSAVACGYERHRIRLRMAVGVARALLAGQRQ
jgi:hypothetical protein